MVMDQALRPDACKLATRLRFNGQSVDVVLEQRKMKQVFKVGSSDSGTLGKSWLLCTVVCCSAFATCSAERMLWAGAAGGQCGADLMPAAASCMRAAGLG